MAIAGAFAVPHPPLILPEIGGGKEQKIQATLDAYRLAAKEAARMHPETVVVISPHAPAYRDYFAVSPGEAAEGDFRDFGAPEVRVGTAYDTEFADALGRQAAAWGIAAGTQGKQEKLDHGTMIPLRFLSEQLNGFRTVRIGLSGLPFSEHYRLGKCIACTAQKLGRRVVVIASGDLSHRLSEQGPYGFAPEGPEYDARVTSVLASGRLEELLLFDENFCERAAQCGHRAFAVLAGCLYNRLLSSRLLSYEGPFGVGYAIASFQDACVALALRTLEYWVARHGGGRPERRWEERCMEMPDDIPGELLNSRAGVFVSLKKNGNLRGCIGTISGVRENLAAEIVENTVSACAYDPRFYPVEAEELKDIVCTVDVLSEPERIASPLQLDAQRYGVIVTKGRRKGLLLPGLPDVTTAAQQIEVALHKAGIRGNEYTLERFEVERHW